MKSVRLHTGSLALVSTERPLVSPLKAFYEVGRCIAAAFQVIWSPLVVAVSTRQRAFVLRSPVRLAGPMSGCLLTPRRWHEKGVPARGSDRRFVSYG